MKKIILLAVTILIGLPITVSAEFYQYTDDAGNIRFTDDLGQVQKFMRKRVRIYHESTSKRPVTAATLKVPLTPKSPQTSAKPKAPRQRFASHWQRLATAQKNLSHQFRVIAKKRRNLAQQRNSVHTGPAAKRYNREVRRLNALINSFERKRQALNARVVAYNRAVNSHASETGGHLNDSQKSFELAQN